MPKSDWTKQLLLWVYNEKPEGKKKKKKRVRNNVLSRFCLFVCFTVDNLMSRRYHHKKAFQTAILI